MATKNTITQELSTDNYPYGRLRCTMFFRVELNPKKGYRAVTQSINPKNGVLNKPKAGNYTDYIYLAKDENDHIKFRQLRFDENSGGITKLQQWLASKPELNFTEEESQYFWAKVISQIRINLSFADSFGSKFKEGVTSNDYLDLLSFKEIVSAFKNKLDIKELINIKYDKVAADDLSFQTNEKAVTVSHFYGFLD